MASSVTTQFNAYNYQTFGCVATTSPEPVFVPDSNTRYLVKSLRGVNNGGAGVELTVQFYSGVDDAVYRVCSAKTFGTDEDRELLMNHPIVISGDLGDELRVFADAGATFHITATVMMRGRETGL